MCRQCWIDYYDAARVDSPAVRAATAAIAAVYAHSEVGGNLHAVLDDWNLDNWEVAAYKQYGPTSPEQEQAERRCIDLLLALTVSERASALARYWGFWGDKMADDKYDK